MTITKSPTSHFALGKSKGSHYISHRSVKKAFYYYLSMKKNFIIIIIKKLIILLLLLKNIIIISAWEKYSPSDAIASFDVHSKHIFFAYADSLSIWLLPLSWCQLMNIKALALTVEVLIPSNRYINHRLACLSPKNTLIDWELVFVAQQTRKYRRRCFQSQLITLKSRPVIGITNSSSHQNSIDLSQHVRRYFWIQPLFNRKHA